MAIHPLTRAPEPIALGLRDWPGFAREHLPKFLAISALGVVPCFWHREIAADDLGSHLYNAWLAQLIHQGRVPGLWLVHPGTNVLFDYILSGLGAVVGLYPGEKIAVAFAVLIFFWGTFAMVTAATGRPPWLIAPLVAMVAYGWTFEMGLFNYYLSLGFAFFGLAIFWRGSGWERSVTVAIALLALIAHPLGFCVLVGACAYLWIAEAAPRRYQIVCFAIAAAGILAVPQILHAFFSIAPAAKPFYFFNGADQLVLFGNKHHRYQIVEYGVIVFVLIAIAVDLIRRRGDGKFWDQYGLPAQLCLLAMISVWVLPESVGLSWAKGSLALLTERFTSISAALACCVLGAMWPRRWHSAATAALAIAFFTSLYLDTGRVNRQEQEIVELVRKLPPNQRVLGTIPAPSGSRVGIQHILDRACIERCFSYGNFEPSSQDFRVRAQPGNPYVAADYDLTNPMALGDYQVQPKDLPLYEIYPCQESPRTSSSGSVWERQKLCIGALRAGKINKPSVQFYHTSAE
jgi:hypothetical protein